MDVLQKAKELRQQLDEYINSKEKADELERLLAPYLGASSVAPGIEKPSTVVGAILQYGVAHPHLRAGPVAEHLVRIGMYSNRGAAMRGVRSTLSNRKELFARVADMAGVYQLHSGPYQPGMRPTRSSRRRGIMAQRRHAFLEYAGQHGGHLVITQARDALLSLGLFKNVVQYRNQSYKLVKTMPEFAPVVPGEFVLKSHQPKPSGITPLRLLLESDHPTDQEPTETNGMGLLAATHEDRAAS